MLAQIQDNTHKAYVALQSYVTSPANIPIPGVVHTDRPKLTRDQMAARYLKSVEGNPDIDINKGGGRQQQKTPKMVQKSSDAKTKDQWATLGDADLTDKPKISHMSRSVSDGLACAPWETVGDYLRKGETSKQLAYEIVGIHDPYSICLMDTPEFVVSTAEYLPRVYLVDAFYPAQELNYRSWPDNQSRPTPPKSTTPAEKINAEIHEALQTNKATRIYLEREQLDSYLIWRLSHGASINFQYIRVDERDFVTIKNFAIGASVISVVGLCIIAGLGIRKLAKYSPKEENAPDSKYFESASERQAEKKETICFNQNVSDRRPVNAKAAAPTLEEVLSPAKTRHQHNTLIDPSSSTSSVSPSTSSTSSRVSFSDSDTDDSESSETVVHISKKTTHDE